jgi:uncharacterized membrane protein
MLNKFLLSALLLPIWFSYTKAASPLSEPAVVHAILFYSPTCGHCHKVITETLTPLLDQYGDQLQVIGIDVTSESGSALFKLALQKFGLQGGGVPFLVVGDSYLYGSVEIPEKFPALVIELLAQGGVDWPDIPGMDQVLQAVNEQALVTQTSTEAEATPVPVQPEQTHRAVNDPDMLAKLALDPAGNTLAIIVLVTMIASFLWVLLNYRRVGMPSLPHGLNWAIPLLCIIGIGVAGYLAYVETTHTEAVCGPVGDCNTVQQSQYATLFGVLPVGILGVVGYLAILAGWLVQRYGKKEWMSAAAVAVFAMATFGLAFSIYLTFLEPFVIGATCAWCLSSAVITLAIFWLSLPEGKTAIAALRAEQQRAASSSPPTLRRRNP